MKVESCLKKFQEGLATILTPEEPTSKQAFYNPAATLTRDLAILFIETIETAQGLEVCDVLGGVGARGIRIAKETTRTRSVWIVERSHTAVDFIYRNIKENGLTAGIYVFEKDANVFLYEHSGFFDYVDIDPFGSPIYFLDGAVRSLRRKGYIAVTATDQKALIGVSPRATLRRYGIKAIKTDMRHDVGLRNLVAAIAFVCARHEYAFTPTLAIAHLHYYRVIGTAERLQAQSALHLRQNIGFIHYCPYCLDRLFSPEVEPTCSCAKPFRLIYPTWIGELYQKDVVEKMLTLLRTRYSYLPTASQLEQYLATILQEINAPVYNIHQVASTYRLNVPPFWYLMSKLEHASLVHHDKYALRTDARIPQLLEIMKKAKVNRNKAEHNTHNANQQKPAP